MTLSCVRGYLGFIVNGALQDMPHERNVNPSCPHRIEPALHAPTSFVEPIITDEAARMIPLNSVSEDVANGNDNSVSVSSSITDTEGFQLKIFKKRREFNASRRSTDTIISEHFVVNRSLTVIFVLEDASKPPTKLNQLRLSELTNSHAPDCIIAIRPNNRLNLIAVDTRNTMPRIHFIK